MFTTTTTTFIRSRLGILFAVAMVVALGPFAGTAKADLIAYWNFNGLVPFEPTPIQIDADWGSGVIDLSGWGADANAHTDSTTLNALFGDPAGLSFNPNGLGAAGSGTPIDIQISMSGLEDLAFSYATRHAGQGWQTQTWFWSVDGTTFTQAVQFSSISTVWQVMEVDLGAIAALNDADTVTLRLINSDPTDSFVGTRFDNIQIHANAIPSPGAIALLGLAGLCGTRRRRAC